MYTNGMISMVILTVWVLYMYYRVSSDTKQNKQRSIILVITLLGSTPIWCYHVITGYLKALQEIALIPVLEQVAPLNKKLFKELDWDNELDLEELAKYIMGLYPENKRIEEGVEINTFYEFKNKWGELLYECWRHCYNTFTVFLIKMFD